MHPLNSMFPHSNVNVTYTNMCICHALLYFHFQYPEYNGRNENHRNGGCVQKILVGIPVEIIDGPFLLLWLIIGIIIGIIVGTLVIGIYHCCIYIREWRLKRSVFPALLLGVVSIHSLHLAILPVTNVCSATRR